MTFASRMNRVTVSPTLKVAADADRLRRQGVDVVDLGGGEQLTVDLLIEIDGVDRPACAAQALFRHYHLKAPD